MSDLKVDEEVRYLRDYFTITIPKDVEKVLKKKQYRDEFTLIHKDKTLAMEYCLIFLSNLMKKQYDQKDHEKWTALSSYELKKQIPGSEGRYRRVIELLLKDEFQSTSIIEVKKNIKGRDTYEPKKKSKQYRLTNKFSNKGCVDYILVNAKIRKHWENYINIESEKSKTNIIVKNLLKVYPNIILPSEDEILIEAKQIILKNKEAIKKGEQINGKLLTILNGRKKSDFKDFNDKRKSYEDCLNNFKFNTFNQKLRFPTISGERAGGRVYDSINMMPSFIRNLIKIDNERVVNVDLKCLHPNLAINLYQGDSKYLTHDLIAKELKLENRIVKVEHLSFFNKHPNQMAESPLFEYYSRKEPNMLKNLIEDKKAKGYKVTSQKMFKLEVKIMAECIRRLNEMNIFPLYIFDALLVKDSNQNTTEFIMNEVIKEMGIYTIVGSHKSPRFIRMVMMKENQ